MGKFQTKFQINKNIHTSKIFRSFLSCSLLYFKKTIRMFNVPYPFTFTNTYFMFLSSCDGNRRLRVLLGRLLIALKSACCCCSVLASEKSQF